MGTSLIADNWSLQDIAQLFVSGVTDSDVGALAVDRAADSHSYASLPQALVSFEALFDLITDIVLRDEILVDDRHTSTWRKFDTPLCSVADSQVIRAYDFLAHADRIAGPREEFVERLCLTSSVRAEHQSNSQEWARNRRTPHPELSAALWGGAGMLARAFVFEKVYTPHPLRRRLFQQAAVMLPDEDAVVRMTGVIRDKQASISQSNVGNDTLYALRLNLPPLPILVIREASDASQLLPIALQMRREYQALRDWLGEYQQALTSTDFSDRKRFETVLRSISMHADSLIGRVDPNAPTFTAGLSALKGAFKGHPIEGLRNRFGVRATMNRLILAGSGLAELRKLLGFFGHRDSGMAVRLVHYFGAKTLAP
jgi:hypothetical protein